MKTVASRREMRFGKDAKCVDEFSACYTPGVYIDFCFTFTQGIVHKRNHEFLDLFKIKARKRKGIRWRKPSFLSGMNLERDKFEPYC